MSTKCILNPHFQELETFVNSLHIHFEDGGTTLYDKRNVIKLFEEGGKRIVAKRFRTPIAIQRLVYSFFRKSKAERAYLNGFELQKRGFSTPESIAYIEVKRHGLLAESYYISTETNLPPIEEQLDKTDFNVSLAEDFADYVVRLHEKGILHHDLNDTNVLYRDGKEGFSFTVIDCNRMRFYAADTWPPLAECMENLTRFTGNYQLFRIVAERYCQTRGLSPSTVDTFMEVKKRHDERRKRRKSFFKRFKKTS